MTLIGLMRRCVVVSMLMFGFGGGMQISTVQAAALPEADPDDGKTFRVFAFHDIRENVRASFDTDPEELAVDQSVLLNFFSWLRDNGYHPITLDQVWASRHGGARLPDKPVLLVFDDGYESSYSKVFPLLKLFRFSAVFALVTEWLEVPAGQQVTSYGRSGVPRAHFLSWAQIAEMSASGLAEFATHTHALHKGIVANPQGNEIPAVVTRRYDARTATYENDAAYQRRLVADLQLGKRLIEMRTGVPVRAVVWPYGAYNDAALAAAESAGLPFAMSLENGPNSPDVPLNRIRRGLVSFEALAPDYLHYLRTSAGFDGDVRPINRVMHVDLDYVYDPNPQRQEENLSILLDRVRKISPTSVFLQAYADPDGDGVADAVYFPNRHLPVRADLFSRVAWQLMTRANVKVYAWMPVMAFHLPRQNPLADVVVETAQGAPHAAHQDRYHRLTPFDPRVRRLIREIYADLGKHARFNGVLFHDDATFNDYEDASPAALRVYQTWGLPSDIAAIRHSPALAHRWSELKTRYLIDFTHELSAVLKAAQPVLTTARNMYAAPLMEADAEHWFAQNYRQFLASYDYTAVMVMPYMERVARPMLWLAQLAQRVAATRGGLDGTIFELQAIDWNIHKPVADEILEQQFSLLRSMGGRHLAYYPDDFLENQPGLALIKRTLSRQSYLESVPGKVEGINAAAGKRWQVRKK